MSGVANRCGSFAHRLGTSFDLPFETCCQDLESDSALDAKLIEL